MGSSRGGGSPAVRVVERVIEKAPVETSTPSTSTAAEPGKARQETRKRKKGTLTSPNIVRPGLTGGADDKLGQ